MTSNEIAQQLATNPVMPSSRLFLAVPFIGKDSPSLTSEFAHPDVVIGLTILAYRYDGLRSSDFHNALANQMSKLGEGFGPMHRRAAAIEFASWVTAAGGRVRGTARRQRRHQYDAPFGSTQLLNGVEYFLPPPGVSIIRNVDVIRSGVPTIPFFDVGNMSGWPPVVIERSDVKFGEPQGRYSCFVKPPQSFNPQGYNIEVDELLFQRIWPLELLTVGNREQFEVLYRLLWREALVIKSLLFDVIFPLTLQHAPQQLSSSGQELGGEQLFPVRLGFSGTPSELLPLELGTTEFEPGTDGQVIHLLTAPEVVTAGLLKDDWDVDKLLSLVATRTNTNAFIDAGKSKSPSIQVLRVGIFEPMRALAAVPIKKKYSLLFIQGL